MESLNRKISEGENLNKADIDLGLSVLFRSYFELNRERYAKELAFKNGRWRQDVYDNFMDTSKEKDDTKIVIEIPNLFTWKEKNDKFMAELNTRIKYTCGGCKFDIMRKPESKDKCPLCNAPYNYNKKKVFQTMEIENTNLDEDNW